MYHHLVRFFINILPEAWHNTREWSGKAAKWRLCVAAPPFPSLGSTDSSWEPFPNALKPQQPNILQPTRPEHWQLCECLSLACSEKIVKVTFKKQQHYQRLRAHLPLPQLRWSVELIMNLKPYLFTLHWWCPSVQNPLESMQTLSVFSALCFLLQPHYLLWLMITLCTISWASKEWRWASEIRLGRY